MESFAVITEVTGNLLRADAEALVNTVNTVGVMGKGIALQFRRGYPEMFQAYQDACERGEVKIGKMFVWETGVLDGPRYVINFPTKRHWRSGSKISYIRDGLADLVRVIAELDIKSIAIPPLGCGNGGLEWHEVEPIIISTLRPLPDLEALLYPPAGAPPAADMVNATARPEMTVGRAALVELLSRYLRNALEATPLEIQKLMYFLQAVGEPLRLDYAKAQYGPYADSLRRVLSLVEGHFLTGYGDGSSRVLEAEAIRPLPGVEAEASKVLADHPETRQRISLVDNLTDGFESMYGMELLATVHWLAVHDAGANVDWRRNAQLVREWTPRKAMMFTDDHVRTAWDRLREHGLVSVGATGPPGREDEIALSQICTVSEYLSLDELDMRLPSAINEAGFPLSDVAVITATLGEAERLIEVLENVGIRTFPLAEFDGTRRDAVKVGTVRGAKGTNFAAVFHPTRALQESDRLTGDERAAADLIQRQELVAFTRAREYFWLGKVRELSPADVRLRQSIRELEAGRDVERKLLE